MNTMNFDPHSYEIQRQRQQQLIALAEQERLVRAIQPAKKRWNPRQLLTFLRRWRLVTPRLHWSGPADEASYN